MRRIPAVINTCHVFANGSIHYASAKRNTGYMNNKIWNIAAIFLIALGIYACGNISANSKIQFYVRGNCDMCKERIETAVKKEVGVVSAGWDQNDQLLTVVFDSLKTGKSALNRAVAKAGHETRSEATPEAVHDALPPCCQKKKI